MEGTNEQLKAGDLVTYTGGTGNKEKGIVKGPAPNPRSVFVTYHCNNEWDRFMEYTGANTNLEDLTFGWPDGDFQLRRCDSCLIETIQKAELLNPDDLDSPGVWQCTKCNETLDFLT